ncbi:MAG TPA: tRNA (cytidine(56)-2'-O)-methyltransferase [Candidatus Thermoplasmatota archaeon]|nr:tRNA (cytidine(56)-2'-O)-methyltransferase [Candidatus Thermoplasmatota archaeon]
MIAVLRIGHRIGRDKRITTHVALVARAFGADRILVSTKDDVLERTIQSITRRFGGTFQIETGVNPKKIIQQWHGTVVHLTMYGEELDKAVAQIDHNDDLLIIVGAEKVPPYYYEAADFNVSVGNQPHSEVAALALFLDRFTRGAWVKKQFYGNIEIIPSNKGKNVKARPSVRSP